MRHSIFLLILLGSACSFAQLRSPEVSPDHRITLRYIAPQANKVVALFETGQKIEMIKDANGVWSAQTSPLEPDYYSYRLLVDGKLIGDPNNPDKKPIAMGGFESMVHIPGPTTLPWETRNVPRGVVHQEHYHSAILGEDRDFYIYTPPGYKRSNRRYPALVLLHGVTETEASWEIAGKASVILDNAIAERKAVPMILVMPNGYGFADVPNNMQKQFGAPAVQRQIMDSFSKVLLSEIAPIVASKYRTNQERAIAGCSLGGAQALYIGLNSPGFGWVGGLSAAVIIYGLPYGNWFPAQLNKPKLTMYCGAEDFLLGADRQFEDYLKTRGIQAHVKETPGAHTWNVWRRCFADYVTKVFR
jgi:enterochelin esterase family protein